MVEWCLGEVVVWRSGEVVMWRSGEVGGWWSDEVVGLPKPGPDCGHSYRWCGWPARGSVEAGGGWLDQVRHG